MRSNGPSLVVNRQSIVKPVSTLIRTLTSHDTTKATSRLGHFYMNHLMQNKLSMILGKMCRLVVHFSTIHTPRRASTKWIAVPACRHHWTKLLRHRIVEYSSMYRTKPITSRSSLAVVQASVPAKESETTVLAMLLVDTTMILIRITSRQWQCQSNKLLYMTLYQPMPIDLTISKSCLNNILRNKQQHITDIFRAIPAFYQWVATNRLQQIQGNVYTRSLMLRMVCKNVQMIWISGPCRRPQVIVCVHQQLMQVLESSSSDRCKSPFWEKSYSPLSMNKSTGVELPTILKLPGTINAPTIHLVHITEKYVTLLLLVIAFHITCSLLEFRQHSTSIVLVLVILQAVALHNNKSKACVATPLSRAPWVPDYPSLSSLLRRATAAFPHRLPLSNLILADQGTIHINSTINCYALEATKSLAAIDSNPKWPWLINMTLGRCHDSSCLAISTKASRRSDQANSSLCFLL